MYSGPVPQQPPRKLAPAATSSRAVSGKLFGGRFVNDLIIDDLWHARIGLDPDRSVRGRPQAAADRHVGGDSLAAVGPHHVRARRGQFFERPVRGSSRS